MIQQAKKWYVVYTKPRWEKKVAAQLMQKEVEHYCPLNKVYRQWSDRKKVIMEPLFTCYVFVRITDREYVRVKEASGVMNFVYWLNKPAVIRDEEIDVIKRIMNDYGSVTLEKSIVKVNDRVRVVGGPLMELQGNVLEVKSKSIRVSLPTLGYTIVAEIQKSNIELLSMSGTSAKSNLLNTMLKNDSQ
jgi:transcription antitermination factor NusG